MSETAERKSFDIHYGPTETTTASIAGRFVMGDAPLPTSSTPEPEPLSDWPFTSEQDLRKFIRKEVHAALDALVREMRMSSEVKL